MSDKLTSWIRTAVPIAIGVLVTWLATRLGVVVDADTSAAITSGVTGLAITLYYSLVRWAESRWPAAGWLLGAAKAPVYVQPADNVRVNGVLRQPGAPND